jgi:hypothetical protein
MLGRRSATNLLSLGGPSGSTSTPNTDNPATAPALRTGIQTDTRLPELLQRSRSAAAAAALGVPAEGSNTTTDPTSKAQTNTLKRSGTEADFSADTRKKQRRRDSLPGGGDNADMSAEAEDPVDVDAANTGDPPNEGPTEVLTTPLTPTPSG